MDKLIEEKIEKKNKPAFYDVDEKNEKNLFENISKQADNALFDNSHKTDKLQKVYDEIDKKTELNSKKQQSSEIKTDAYSTFNPFYGDKNALEKMSNHNYKQVVEEPVPSEKIEIKEEIKIEPIKRKEKKFERKHLWIGAISVCLVLFTFVFGYNMISINSLAKNTIKTQHKISEIEQQMEQNAADYSDVIKDENMLKADIENSMKADLSPKNTTPRYTESSSAWDKFCDFFARLFGK